MACLPTTGRKQPPLIVAIASKQTITIDKHQIKMKPRTCKHTTLTHACRVKVLHAGCQTYGSVKTARVTRKHGVTTMNPCALLAAQLMCKPPTPATHIGLKPIPPLSRRTAFDFADPHTNGPTFALWVCVGAIPRNEPLTKLFQLSKPRDH